MLEKIKKIKEEALKEIGKASANDIEQIRVKFLGRKSELTEIMRSIGSLTVAEKKKVGAEANKVRTEIEGAMSEKERELTAGQEKEQVDITAPGVKYPNGHMHPISQFIYNAVEIFKTMGFEVYESPEVDYTFYNFDAINVPKDHPARDAWDTFYIEDGKPLSDEHKLLLRTHTSNAQVRAMETRKPPVRIVVPGRCYRNEATDASHEATFYQMEGFVIDKDIKVTDLLGTLDHFAKQIFGPEVETRARPHFYPFTEPSIDIDMSCILCGGKGCAVCKHSGWLEVMPCGMIHPNVLRNMGVDPEIYSGFAFGFGIDRLMMLYRGINDIRLSYSGDLNFLEQF